MHTQTDSSDGSSGNPPAPIQSFTTFLRSLDRDTVTGWDWRRAGMITNNNTAMRAAELEGEER